MFLPGHWSHIFVGCFIEEIAEEKGEPLAPRTKYGMIENRGISRYPTTPHQSNLRARAKTIITNGGICKLPRTVPTTMAERRFIL